MILDEAALRALLHTVFTVYTAFWITVLVLLYLLGNGGPKHCLGPRCERQTGWTQAELARRVGV